MGELQTGDHQVGPPAAPGAGLARPGVETGAGSRSAAGPEFRAVPDLDPAAADDVEPAEREREVDDRERARERDGPRRAAPGADEQVRRAGAQDADRDEGGATR